MARSYTPDEIVRTVAKRRWWILAPFAVGLAAAPLLAPLAPERYRSETLILVVPQRVPDDYVKPTVTESVEERLPAITEQILSRSRLERIIQEMDLYREERQRTVMEDVVAKMRQDVNVSVAAASARDRADSFRVSYVSHNPEVARKVTERLASLYIEQNVSDRASQAQSTSQFLATQLEDAKRRLIEQEKKLEEYRKQHQGELPTQMQGNLQAIQNANMQLQALSESTNRALERRLLIERQIADIQAIPLPAAPMPAAQEAPVAATAAQQLEIVRGRRAALLQRYTPDHPEIVALDRTIEELTSRADGETPLGGSAPAETPMSPAEAAQRKKILDLQAELAVVDHQLSANKAEDARLKRVIADYQSKVDAAPTRESELVELTRDYSTLQAAYASLLMKREDSAIAENLENRQIGEQFRILDPASRPEKPFNFSQRLGVMASGAIAGLVLGLLAVGFMEFRDSSFRREEEIHQALSLPVLAMIPVMKSDRELRAARSRRMLMDVAGSALLMAAVAVVVIWQLQA